jgi:hypothetical protein
VVRKLKLLFIILLTINQSFAQLNTTSFGISIKPIFPSKYFRTGPIDFSDKGINYTLAQTSGFSAGALVRQGITKRLSLETGLLFVKRNFNLSIKDTTWTGESSFKIIAYEIPVSALVFIQLGKEIYMSTALGASLDIFPSDVESYSNSDKYFRHFSSRKSKINSGIIANLGLEWRSKKSGILYFGGSYHRSMTSIYNTLVEYYPDRNYQNETSSGRTKLQGDYLTFDFRYYFHEDPTKKKK